MSLNSNNYTVNASRNEGKTHHMLDLDEPNMREGKLGISHWTAMTVFVYLMIGVNLSAPCHAMSQEERAQSIIEQANKLLQPFDDRPLLLNVEEPILADIVWTIFWVYRVELLERKAHWKRWLEDQSMPWGRNESEDEVGLHFFTNNVARYARTIRANAYLKDHIIWDVWFAPESGQKLYQEVILDTRSAIEVLDTPTNDSICVIVRYLREGRYWEKHFYVPSILEINQLIGLIQEGGELCSTWSHNDERFAIPLWVIEDLRYDEEQIYNSLHAR